MARFYLHESGLEGVLEIKQTNCCRCYFFTEFVHERIAIRVSKNAKREKPMKNSLECFNSRTSPLHFLFVTTMRRLTQLFLFALLGHSIFADDKNLVLKNPQAQSVLTQLQKDLDIAEDAKRKVVVKAIQAAIPKLEKALKDAMAKGDLDGANAIKAKVDALKEELAQTDPSPKALTSSFNPVGTWKVPIMNRTEEISANGTCHSIGLFAEAKAFPDQGRWKRLADGSVEVRFDSGWVQKIRPIKDKPAQIEIESINPAGQNTGKAVWDLLGNR